MKWRARIRGFLDMQSPQGLLDKIKMLPKLAELGSFFPKTVKTGPCKEVIQPRRIFSFRISRSCSAGRKMRDDLSPGRW